MKPSTSLSTFSGISTFSSTVGIVSISIWESNRFEDSKVDSPSVFEIPAWNKRSLLRESNEPETGTAALIPEIWMGKSWN